MQECGTLIFALLPWLVNVGKTVSCHGFNVFFFVCKFMYNNMHSNWQYTINMQRRRSYPSRYITLNRSNISFTTDI